MKIGFIGLGIMGAPMVGRLLDGGHQVFVNDLNPIRPEILEKGATQVSSAREAAEMGDVIIVMVPDTPDVEIVLFGENSSLPHGSSGNNRLKKGDFVMFDLGVKWEGYSSDITRTFIFGSEDSQKKEIYNIVLEANLKAIKNCQPGAIIGEVDKISRNIIEEAGYGEFYPHRIGHGIGLEGHESPSMNSLNPDRLIEGMIFTIEPGIYMPKVGGVRIEDELVITEKGPELLTKYPKELRII